MTNVTSINNRNASVQDSRLEASRWVARLMQNELTDEGLKELELWLKQDPKHADYFMEFARLDDELSSLRVLEPVFPLQTPQRGKVRRVTEGLKSRWQVYGVSAAFTVFLVLSVFHFGGLMRPIEASPVAVNPIAVHSTPLGESRVVELSDGSRIILNSLSRVDVSLGENWRALTLQYGEAQFDVAPDATRPFVVRAGNHVVRAIGTAFNIRKRETEVEVLVTHGVVSLANVSEQDDLAIGSMGWVEPAVVQPVFAQNKIEAGESAELRQTRTPKIKPVLPEEMASKLAWQQGEIIFHGESLEEVINEVNRYTAAKIYIVDPNIKEIPIGGRFKTGEVQALLDILEHGFDIKATVKTPSRIELAQVLPSKAVTQ